MQNTGNYTWHRRHHFMTHMQCLIIQMLLWSMCWWPHALLGMNLYYQSLRQERPCGHHHLTWNGSSRVREEATRKGSKADKSNGCSRRGDAKMVFFLLMRNCFLERQPASAPSFNGEGGLLGRRWGQKVWPIGKGDIPQLGTSHNTSAIYVNFNIFDFGVP